MNQLSPLSLLKLAEAGEIAKTGAKPKLPTTIPNLTDSMLDVYRIPLKHLYYNNENGRIASAISRLENVPEPSRDDDNPTYNEVIEQIIIEDNKTSLKGTKISIAEKGQQIFGYVLNDGRVIDGNRRFTALRQIAKEQGISGYFEAVILPFTYASKADRAEIKRLELAIQMGQEDKIAYDPVDLAVDIFQTIKISGLMTVKEYAKEANIKEKEIEDCIHAAELMQDYLKFINAPDNAYFIVKDAGLYTSIYELGKKLKKSCKLGTPIYNKTKNTAFTILNNLFLTGSDIGRNFRTYMKEILETPNNKSFNETLEDAIEDLTDKFDEEPIRSVSDLTKVLNKSTAIIREIQHEYNQTINRQSRGKNVDDFISDIQLIKDNLSELVKGNGLNGSLSFNNFSKDQLIELRDHLIKINIVSKELVEIYDDKL